MPDWSLITLADSIAKSIDKTMHFTYTPWFNGEERMSICGLRLPAGKLTTHYDFHDPKHVVTCKTCLERLET